MQSVCTSSIDEKIPGLRVRDIPLSDGSSCVVAQVPNSVRKPHMAVHRKHRSFRIRRGRSKSLMSMQEVRNMIISMSRYAESLASFLNERKAELRSLAGEQPWLLLMATPVYVDREKVNPLREEIRTVLRTSLSRSDEHVGLTVEPEPRIFGVEARSGRTNDRMIRLFWNGHLEYGEDCTDWADRRGPDDAFSIYSSLVVRKLLHFLATAKEIIRAGEINEPIAVTMYWYNVAPSYLHWWRHPKGVRHWDDVYVWRDRSLTIEATVNELTEPVAIARPIMDRLFYAFGCENNPHFDADGEFVAQG